MSKKDEFSSTEKLLDLIRSDDAEAERLRISPSKQTSKKARKRSPKRTLPSKGKITVGLDLGEKEMKLVMINQPSGNQWRLLGFAAVPIDPVIPRESHEFDLFFKKNLSHFCRFLKNFDLWGLIHSTQVEIRHIRIPKVPNKQLSNAVYWTLRKEMPFDESQTTYDYEILGDEVEDGIQKTAVMVYTAPKQVLEMTKTLITKAGYTPTGLSIAPFAIQNLLRTRLIDADDGSTAFLYVGAEWLRIDILSSDHLVFTRAVKGGMNSLVDGIIQGVTVHQAKMSSDFSKSSDFSVTALLETKRAVSFEAAKKILFRLTPYSQDFEQEDPGFDLSEDEVINMVHPPLDRLIRQVERSLEHYSSTSGNDRIAKVLLGGQIIAFERLVEHVREQLGLPVEAIDPLSPKTPFVGNVSTAHLGIKRASFAPAVGIALSDNARTPNLLVTKRDKEEMTRTRQINRTAMTIGLFILVICLGVFLWQKSVSKEKNLRIAALKNQLEKYEPHVDQNLILQLATNAKIQKQSLKEYSKRYLGMALIGELSRISPPNMRLIDLVTKFGRVPEKKNKGRKRSILMEGVIFGDQKMFEASLAAFVLKLGNTPLFGQARIHKSMLDSFNGKEVFRFAVEVDLV